MIDSNAISGLILAGGEGRRMGGQDKGLVPLLGPPLVEHAALRLRGRTREVIINANRHHARHGEHCDRVISDAEGGFHGPLMGIYSGLRAATTDWLVVIPCDAPLLPMDLVERLVAGIGDHAIAVASDGERLHPVVALMRTDLADDLAKCLADGERKIDRWYARHAWCRVDMADCSDRFANLNTAEDLERAQAFLLDLPWQDPWR